MTVNTLAVGGGRDVLEVRVDGLAEERNLGLVVDGGVVGGLAEGNAGLADGAARLGTALLEAAGGGRLVGGAVLAVHLVVGELDDHLHKGVGRALELLDQALAVALVGLDGELVLADDVVEVGDGAVDLGLNLLGDGELDGLGLGQVRANRGVGEVELVVEDDVVDEVVEAVGGGSVHHAVLAHETGGAVVVDDELERLVVPAVLAVTVPVLVGALLEGDGGGIVKADDEGRSLNGLESLGVLGVGGEESGAGIGPDVTVLGGESTDGGGARSGELVNALEGLLKLSGVELLAVNLVVDLVELVLADGKDVLVLIGAELDGVVGGLGSNTAGVEHPLVRVHANGELLHVLGLESAGVDHLLELESGGGDGSGALGGVAAAAVIAVGVEVADVGDNGIAVGEVGCVVPPLVDPVLVLGVLATSDELLLELATRAVGGNKGINGLLAVLELLLAEKGLQRLVVAGSRLLESRDGQTGEGVLEAEHGALGLVLDIASGEGAGLSCLGHGGDSLEQKACQSRVRKAGKRGYRS